MPTVHKTYSVLKKFVEGRSHLGVLITILEKNRCRSAAWERRAGSKKDWGGTSDCSTALGCLRNSEENSGAKTEFGGDALRLHLPQSDIRGESNLCMNILNAESNPT